MVIIRFVLGLAMFANVLSTTQRTLCGTPAVAVEPEEGEAFIWYLDHSGWAIQTRTRLLVFDYIERSPRPAHPSLENGFISPSEIKDLKVMVFVSHSHGDHNDPVIFEWEKSVPDITYVLGWEGRKGPNIVSCGYQRENLTVDGVEISTVVHDFDRVPESAFLVSLDGLVIFHSGDHGSGPPPFKPLFLDSIEYLSRIAPRIDLAFIPLFGEELYVAEKLEAKYTFPMHSDSFQYQEFKTQAAEKKLPTRVVPAERMGQKFFFRQGSPLE